MFHAFFLLHTHTHTCVQRQISKDITMSYHTLNNPPTKIVITTGTSVVSPSSLNFSPHCRFTLKISLQVAVWWRLQKIPLLSWNGAVRGKGTKLRFIVWFPCCNMSYGSQQVIIAHYVILILCFHSLKSWLFKSFNIPKILILAWILPELSRSLIFHHPLMGVVWKFGCFESKIEYHPPSSSSRNHQEKSCPSTQKSA